MAKKVSHGPLHWRVPAALGEGAPDELVFILAEPGPGTRVEGDELVFEIPPGEHVYATAPEPDALRRGPVRSALPVRPGSSCELAGHADVEGGPVSLWVVEFAGGRRASAWRERLGRGPFALRWRWSADVDRCVVALRLSGCGAISLPSLWVDAEGAGHDVRVGPRGGFRLRSPFYDPAGYRSLGPGHHGFYADRRPDWYARLAHRFTGCRRVLDLGCGPGLLLSALRDAGVEAPFGLERDPSFLTQARASGRDVTGHDLNWPFPFVASESVDGAIAHHTLDYLAPVARLQAVRELHRVLRPGRLLVVASRSDGPASGDGLRSVALSPGEMQETLEQNGFRIESSEAGERSFSVSARRSEGEGATWDRRATQGLPFRPWGKRRQVLPLESDAWDQLSRRDFTPVVTPEKEEVKVAGRLLAVYTGYRKNDSDEVERAVCLADSETGTTWRRRLSGAPVLTGGDGWDAGGVAAGSTIQLQDGGLLMFYSGRGADGRWRGVGIAESEDGITWTKLPAPVLTRDPHPEVRHLALADVIRTAHGEWVMHCEGLIEGVGWAIFQARSPNGRSWTAAGEGPVLRGGDIPWGGVEVANPKCLELEPGRFLLAFNGAGKDRRFQLGLATSDDLRTWQEFGANPVISTAAGEHRLESLFMTRTALDRGDHRAFFFAARTPRTHESSDVLVAAADTTASWAPAGWTSRHLGAYTMHAARLVAAPGAAPIVRPIPTEQDVQVTLALPRLPSVGEVVIELADRGGQAVGTVDLADGPAADEAVAGCVRVLSPQSDHPELAVQVWRESVLVHDRQELLDGPVGSLAVRVRASDRDLEVDHAVVWTPPELHRGEQGDAHVYLGRARSGDPLLPDVGAQEVAQLLTGCQIDRVLAMAHGSGRPQDTFDQIAPMASADPRIATLFRSRWGAATDAGVAEYHVDQLELLWQLGLMVGIKAHLGHDEAPPAPVLDWAEHRGVITMWHVRSVADLEWIKANALSRPSLPVLLSHFGGYPADRARYAAAIDLLNEHPELYLVTSCVWFGWYLREACERHPERVLLGSDYPAVEPSVARAAIEVLDLDDRRRALVEGENLRFLVERTNAIRTRILEEKSDLRFPPPPRDAAELEAQGFVVVDPADLPAAEPEAAKSIWEGRGVRGWYRDQKPYASAFVELVRDLAPASVLEFGCNVGRNLAAIVESMPCTSCVGIDVNPEAVEAGRASTGLDLRHGDEQALGELDAQSFDLVFTLSVLDHIPDIEAVCRELIRCARRHVVCVEVELPTEGRVVEHFDHRAREVKSSTAASYSWQVARRLEQDPRMWRVESRPTYLHAAALGPYYTTTVAFLEWTR